MHPVLILLIGILIVVGGVLLFRLHAFLALILAALVVGALTPAHSLQQYWVQQGAVPFSVDDSGSDSGNSVQLHWGTNDGARVGSTFVILRPDQQSGGLSQLDAEVQITAIQDDALSGPRSQAQVVGGTEVIQPDDILITPSALKSARAVARQTVGERVAAAFGDTCGKIGILIAMAAIIGKCLLDSGAADKIVRAAMRIVGERGAPIAFVSSGFLLGIPVFFDTVFYLMMPLGKASRMRTGRNYLLYILSIVAGGSMAHSLVPPTPGPLFVAEQLQVDIGLMILAGCFVGSFSSTAALIYAYWVNRRAEVPLRESPDFSLQEIEEIAQREESQLPALWLALAPIVLPVVLIAGFTFIKSFGLLDPSSPIFQLAATFGNKNIALTVATAIAMGMLVWQTKSRLRDLADSVQGALASGGVIILITAGGGAFGAMLKQTGVANLISNLPNYSPLVIILLAFLITTAVRTAQGSATVAMITAVGILAGFATSGNLGCHPVYLALAIGCGSKPIAWMNDSGFWVICKMSGMTEAEGLRFVTPMSILMGIVGLIVTMILAMLFP